MLLRRFMQHVRDQNWFVVAVDFLIVVVGVFVGLEAQHWSEAHKDRRTEASYRADILSDLLEDQRDLANVRASSVAQVIAINYLLQAALDEEPPQGIEVPMGNYSAIGTSLIPLPRGPAPSAERMRSLWATVNFTRTANANRGAFDALIGTGDIALIRDHELVRAMQVYYNLFESLEATQSSALQPIWSETISAGRVRGISAFGAVDQSVLIDAIRASPEFAATLRTAREASTLHLTLVSGLEARANNLIDMLKGRD